MPSAELAGRAIVSIGISSVLFALLLSCEGGVGGGDVGPLDAGVPDGGVGIDSGPVDADTLDGDVGTDSGTDSGPVDAGASDGGIGADSGLDAGVPPVLITSVTFDGSTLERRAPGSDNWAVTWAADGNMYATWGDGGGFGGTNSSGRVSMGVARMRGAPETFVGENVWGGFESENPASFGGKSLGMLSLGGILYMWQGPGSGFTAWEQTSLAWSDDMGATWALSTSPLFRHTDGLSKPTFLNFGRDYAGARDGFVYVYAPDGSAGAGGPITDVTLARVSRTSVRNRASYEFFAGLNRAGDPIWTPNVAMRVPVMSDPSGVADSPSVVYNAPLGLYLMSKTHGTATRAHGGLSIHQAAEPWGPFIEVFRENDWMGSRNMYFATFPPKWISADGLTLWMIFTGYGADVIAQDAYQHMRLTLTVR